MAFISLILGPISDRRHHSYGNLGRAKDVREVLPGAEKRNRDLLEPAFPK